MSHIFPKTASTSLLGNSAPTLVKSDHFSNPQSTKPGFTLPLQTRHLPPIDPPPTTPDLDIMFLQRSAVAVARRAAVAPVLRRSLATSAVRRKFRIQALPPKIPTGPSFAKCRAPDNHDNRARSLPTPTPPFAQLAANLEIMKLTMVDF